MHYQDMLRLLDNRHPRFGTLWMAGVETGLRISDLLSLDAQTVISGAAWKVIEQKTGKSRNIELSSTLTQRLMDIVSNSRLSETDKIFYRSSNNKKVSITRQWAHRIIARSASLIGLNDVGAHSMRKMYACNLFRSTGSLKRVQDELNHKYPSTTMIYLMDLLPSSDD